LAFFALVDVAFFIVLCFAYQLLRSWERAHKLLSPEGATLWRQGLVGFVVSGHRKKGWTLSELWTFLSSCLLSVFPESTGESLRTLGGLGGFEGLVRFLGFFRKVPWI